ncbi:MAG: YceI family protein [Burkholderiaceae bacterium]|nr:YceI family protein [Roseateles sp.]MBV8470296.1 YceI family protein [Burkholderiaceae bacterium]
MRTLASTLLTLSTAALTMLAAPQAQAQSSSPTLVPAQSELGFTSKQMGVPVDGHFKRFDAHLNFDPKKPDTGSVSFSIDLGSVTLGDPQFDTELAKPEWFDSKKQAQASFQSKSIKALGAGKFEVSGKLSIKGQQRDVVVPVSLSQNGSLTTAVGSFVLKRLEFKIGDGDWSDTSMVANEVQVKFKLNFNGIAKL